MITSVFYIWCPKTEYVEKPESDHLLPLCWDHCLIWAKMNCQLSACLEVKPFAMCSPEGLCRWLPFDTSILGLQSTGREVSPRPPFSNRLSCQKLLSFSPGLREGRGESPLWQAQRRGLASLSSGEPRGSMLPFRRKWEQDQAGEWGQDRKLWPWPSFHGTQGRVSYQQGLSDQLRHSIKCISFGGFVFLKSIL